MYGSIMNYINVGPKDELPKFICMPSIVKAVCFRNIHASQCIGHIETGALPNRQIEAMLFLSETIAM